MDLENYIPRFSPEQMVESIRNNVLKGREEILKTYIAEVKAVDMKDLSCTVVTVNGKQELELKGVMLIATSDDGLIQVPAIESQVIILVSNKSRPRVIQFSELQALYIYMGNGTLIKLFDGQILQAVKNAKIDMGKDGIKINDGSFGGIPIADKIADEVNLLRSEMNAIKEAVTAGGGYSNPTDANTALLTLVTSGWNTQKLAPIKSEDLQNKDVTHGKI